MFTWTIVSLLIFVKYINALEGSDVVFVILSQRNDYHVRLATERRDDIWRQAEALGKGRPPVHLSHADFPHVGGWTITPLIPRLAQLHGNNGSYVFFMGDTTRVDLSVLLEVLEEHREDKEEFIGHGLSDREPSIIHHFAFYNDPTSFKYPNIASGFAIGLILLKRLNDRLKSLNPKTDFNIDVSHELALFIWDNGGGAKLTHDIRLCVQKDKNCATFPESFKSCGQPVSKNSVYFAVKTCSKFHEDRVPVVKKTWGRHAVIIKYFSDVADDEVPTVTLGVPNTEQGHCEKTFSIIRHVWKEIAPARHVKWIVIADDDTILSVSGLGQLLSCYEGSEPVALGERYGYGALSSKGYNYITGGGGMVISRPLLGLLADPANCRCPTASTPDDMYLGFCLRELGVDVTHSPLFHQARPDDYATGYLRSHSAVSFHKHWMLDPVKVYKKWFAKMDADLTAHTEL